MIPYFKGLKVFKFVLLLVLIHCLLPMKKHNFSAGPSILTPSVLEQAAQAVVDLNNSGLSILEISHRSQDFVSILESTKKMVLELMNLENKGYQVLFLQGGASMEFCRIPQNLLSINGKAAYVNTGTWANNAMNEAKYFGEVIEIASSKDRKYNYIPELPEIDEKIDYLHITSNNTIYGTQFHKFPKVNSPLVCDMSSDIFSRPLDFSAFDMIYAGAQKNLGPSGTSLIVIREEILGKTGRIIPSILDYQKHIAKESMFNTPAVYPIYVIYLTLQWIINQGGLEVLEKKNKEKAALLYQEIDDNPLFKGTAEVKDRSLMNVTFTLSDTTLTEKFDALCVSAGISGIKGHRSVGGYRASIYNAMPIESVKVLVEVMKQLN